MRVLVVDDEPRVRAALRVMLEVLGFEVVEAGDGRSATRALGDAPADVILCDLFMAGQDGLELLRELRPAASGCEPCAACTGRPPPAPTDTSSPRMVRRRRDTAAKKATIRMTAARLKIST